MRFRRRIGFADVPLAVLCAGLLLQGCYVTHTYKTLRDAPEVAESRSLAMEVAVVAGKVRIDAEAGDRLYDLDLRYCESHYAPRVIRSDSGDRASVRIGLKRHWSIAQPPPGDERNRLDLGLTRDAPLDLVLDLGAGEHYAQLGGLRLRSLDLSTGKGRVTIDFDRPTADEMRLLRANVGPGGLHIGGLGNASPDVMSLAGGGGEVTIDLGGPWDNNGDIQLDVSLGDVTLILPADLGLRVVARDRVLDDLELPGFARDELGDFVSSGFEAAKHHMIVRSGRGLGMLRVVRNE